MALIQEAIASRTLAAERGGSSSWRVGDETGPGRKDDRVPDCPPALPTPLGLPMHDVARCPDETKALYSYEPIPNTLLCVLP